MTVKTTNHEYMTKYGNLIVVVPINDNSQPMLGLALVLLLLLNPRVKV